ncbi:hypothetical protein OG339_47265 (plasmid) [Streptosporangium sp. NBC_01495]|uniref:hypothetical protein n=1 Tax=Streptosporangium sp. NBC_01495 TaxID=2903899 RepID=UPI002E301D52|nr:hypothetical protein [Streptosporangium sp. NBC_01495]
MDFSALNLPGTYLADWDRDLARIPRDAREATRRWASSQHVAAINAGKTAKEGTASAHRLTIRARVFGDLGAGIDLTAAELRTQATELTAEADAALTAAGGELTSRSHVPRCKAEVLHEIADKLDECTAALTDETVAEWRKTAAWYHGQES